MECGKYESLLHASLVAAQGRGVGEAGLLMIGPMASRGRRCRGTEATLDVL